MKTCKICNLEKEDTEYYSTGNGYLRPECKKCKSSLEKGYQQERRKLFYEWKSTLVCNRCGFDDPRALQFHHTNDDKEYNISNMASSYSLSTIKEEASKCEVLCANCHQIEHAGVAQG